VSESSDLGFRPLTRSDFPLLSRWLASPHVKTWWREDHEIEAMEERYGPAVDAIDATECFIIELAGDPIGMIQGYLIDQNPEWQRALVVTGSPNNAAGLDYLIGDESLIGRGLGPKVIERFVEYIWARYPSIQAIVVSVHEDNYRSWRALEKSGFVRTWSGEIVSDDPSDAGPSHVYLLDR
jgi:aminoglycoside 6'-N-acetyltransferase